MAQCAVAPSEGGINHSRKLLSVGVRWEECGGIVGNLDVGSPSVVNDAYPPKAMSGVLPPLEDDGAVERNFTSGAVEENIATGVAEDSDREEIVS